MYSPLALGKTHARNVRVFGTGLRPWSLLQLAKRFRVGAPISNWWYLRHRRRIQNENAYVLVGTINGSWTSLTFRRITGVAWGWGWESYYMKAMIEERCTCSRRLCTAISMTSVSYMQYKSGLEFTTIIEGNWARFAGWTSWNNSHMSVGSLRANAGARS